MIDKLAASVVWSINARRSTLEHARKIWELSLARPHLLVTASTNRDDSTLRHIIGLLVESDISPILVGCGTLRWF
jgi:hypothetical protein